MRTRGGFREKEGLEWGGGIEAGFVGGVSGRSEGRDVRWVFPESCSSWGGVGESVCAGVGSEGCAGGTAAFSGMVWTFFNALPLLFLDFMSGRSTLRRRSSSSSLLLLVRPGRSRPTYAPRIMRSISDSPGFSSSKLRDLMLFPNTMARCSLLSESFW